MWAPDFLTRAGTDAKQLGVQEVASYTTERNSENYRSIRYCTPARVSSGPACACTEKSFFSL